MKPRGYFYCGLTTTLNVLLNAVTFGRYLWLEGRVRNGWFRNWLREFRYKPREFSKPTSEAEIIDLIKSSSSLRVFGAGHSFNAGVVSDDTLISLDGYQGVIAKDLEKKQVALR